MPPQPEEIDPLEEVRTDVKRILAAVVGGLEPNGTYHRGLLDRVHRLEQALAWIIGVGTAAVIAIVSAFATGHVPGGKA